VELRSRPWLPDYTRRVRNGGAGLYLLGWIGDYADAGAFLDPIFGQTADRFGFTSPALAALLDRARAQPEVRRRARLYRAANRLLATLLPGVPFVTTREPVGVRRGVSGFRPSPLGFDSFAGVAVSRA